MKGSRGGTPMKNSRTFRPWRPAPPRCRPWRLARAQSTYPIRLVRIIVGSAAGSAPDILARLIAEWLSGRLGQPFVVENRPGAGGNVATEAVVKAVADGHTHCRRLKTLYGAHRCQLRKTHACESFCHVT